MFFITAAYATGASAQASPIYMQFIPLILVGFVMYFLIFRPESKKRKVHEEKIASIKAGTKVVTSGGILGKITKVEAESFVLEIGQNIHVHILKSAVVRILDQDKLSAAQKNQEKKHA